MLSLPDAVRALTDVGRRFYGRGWVLGTSGNFSAVLSQRPLRLVITASATHKGALEPAQFLEIDERCRVLSTIPGQRPSAEALLHLELIETRGAGAVLHTHSVWSTILSDRCTSAGGLEISGYEMLKGLEQVRTHEHREWIPALENDQDMPRLAAVVRRSLHEHPGSHAFLLRRHGLYTWGATIAEAERHVEILEFLLESIGRTESAERGL